MLEILKNEIGIRGVAFQWFDSYLRDRTQKVKIGDEFSEDR